MARLATKITSDPQSTADPGPVGLLGVIGVRGTVGGGADVFPSSDEEVAVGVGDANVGLGDGVGIGKAFTSSSRASSVPTE